MLKQHSIKLTKHEINSNLSRVRHAENLIKQLKGNHKGRNIWLTLYGTSNEAMALRQAKGLVFNPSTNSAEPGAQQEDYNGS